MTERHVETTTPQRVYLPDTPRLSSGSFHENVIMFFMDHAGCNIELIRLREKHQINLIKLIFN